MENEPSFFETGPKAGVVGKPLNRVDGRDKVMGRAKYSAEFPLPGLTYGVLKTSEIADRPHDTHGFPPPPPTHYAKTADSAIAHTLGGGRLQSCA